MIDFLLGVPGKLKTISDFLTTNWTAVRAAKVDNLDAAVSSRAAATTALTNVTWTDARAAKLDLIAASGSVIQSIQTGVYGGDMYQTGAGKNITITAVNVAKSIVLLQPSRTLVISGYVENPRGNLTSSTNLNIYVGTADAQNSVIWTVLEFK
jgi:hypothetical protein